MRLVHSILIWLDFAFIIAGKYSEKIIQARKKERFVSDLCRFVSERHTICFIIIIFAAENPKSQRHDKISHRFAELQRPS